VDHDQLFKELLRVCFVDFLALFLPKVLKYLDTSSIEFIEQETFSDITQREKSVVDLLVKARFKGKLTYFLIHVEAQSDKRYWSGKRMFYYFAVQTYKHDLPVYPIALLSWDSPLEADTGQYSVEFPDRRVLEFNYAVIQLNRMDWRKYRRRDNAAASALMAKMGVKPHERPKVRAACMRMLARLELPEKKRNEILRFVDAYLPLTLAQQEEFAREVNRFKPKEKEVVMEYITSWERKGREEGKVEGKVEGKQESTFKLLKRQIGKLSETTQERIRNLSLAELDLLFDAAFDFKKKSELNEWLRKHTLVANETRRAD
jgi:hypothetical protein